MSEERFERIERQIAFIVDQQSKFLTDIERLKESQAAMVEIQAQTSADVRDLARVVADLAGTVSHMDTRMDRFEAQAESDRQEIREAIGKLIEVNEDTRKYTQEIAHLVKQTEQRVTKLEDRS